MAIFHLTRQTRRVFPRLPQRSLQQPDYHRPFFILPCFVAIVNNTMFAIHSQKQSHGSEGENSTECCTPNIIPCRIHHDGPVESLDRYWQPVADKEDRNLQTSHFRGRKLRGRRVAIPEGYQGIIAMPTERTLPPASKHNPSTDDIEDEPEEPVKILEKQATFDEFLVWDHETIPAVDDPYVKGVEEWLKLAEAMHTTPSVKETEEKPST